MDTAGVTDRKTLTAVGGSEGRYEALFRANFSAVLRLAALVGADDPEDVAQEAFARLHRKQDTLQNADAALSYVRRTAVNLSRSRLRHLQVVRRKAASQWVPHHESAELAAAVRQEHRDLLVALRRLPDGQRAVLVLSYWLDLSPHQIAETLGIPLGTVKSTTSRAINALDRALTKDTK